MEQQLVVFDVADEHYGVDIAAVEAIIKMQPVTAVPQAPPFVEGVTNLRGKILPVIDLRKRFGLPPLTPANETAARKNMRIVVVDMKGQTVGMIVDGVSEVLRISADAIEPPSPLVTTVASTFIQSIAKAGERLVIILDLQHVLSPRETEELHAAAVSGG